MPVNEFFLSTETAVNLQTACSDPGQRWIHIPHAGNGSLAYVLFTGEALEFGPDLRPTPDTRLLLRYSAANAAQAECSLSLSVRIAVHGKVQQLVELAIPANGIGLNPIEAVVDLSAYAGEACKLTLHAVPDANANSSGGSLAIYECVIANSENLPNVRARTFRSERSANELAHFTAVYDHQIYRDSSPDRGAACDASQSTPVHSLSSLIERPAAASHGVPGAVQSPEYPSPADLPPGLRDPYHYTHYLLSTQLRSIAPDFVQRLKVLGAQRPLRILSLCSGSARIEASFAAAAGIEAHWTLMDLSEPLLHSAAEGFPDGTNLSLIVGDLNLIRDFGERFDVILCVSGLHHIVELEKVIGFIQAALTEDGEFWSIGEAIGRNGNRLWGNDYAVANKFFQSLPERLRFNRGSAVTDGNLPNTDFSSGTFEGIRSEDIEPVLARYLEPVHVYRRNCFLWRLVDLAYAENYRMDSDEDLLWLQRAVNLELDHFRSGGRPTELHGVFRRRSH